MNGIVVYGSVYGTTEQYARELAKQLRFDLTPAKDFNRQKAALYDCCVHGGGLYAGGVSGLSKTAKALDNLPNIDLFIFTVGLSDPANEENANHIRFSLQKQLPASRFNLNKIFHLRGGINYERLSIAHRAMMTLVYKKAKKMPVEKQSEEVKAMIETFGKAVDFVNYDSLIPIIHAIQ